MTTTTTTTALLIDGTASLPTDLRRAAMSALSCTEPTPTCSSTCPNEELLKTLLEIAKNACPFSQSECRTHIPAETNVSPFTISECTRYAFPLKTSHDTSTARRERRKRVTSAPRARLRSRGQLHEQQIKLSSVGEAEINATMLTNGDNHNHVNNFDSIDSVSPGDIFFSHDYNVFDRNGAANANAAPTILPKPPGYNVGRNNSLIHPLQKVHVNNESFLMSQTIQRGIDVSNHIRSSIDNIDFMFP